MSPRALVVPFTKMHGAGNDFVVLDNRFLRFTDEELAGLARRYCPRRLGVGADGLLALDPPDADGADFRMRYRNADGSLGTMCGNGARCLARFAHEAGVGGTARGHGRTRLVFDTDGGRYTADLAADGRTVRLHVPPPRDFGPVTLDEARVAGETWRIWTGTEHAVRFVDDVEAAPVATEGPALRHDPALAPAGANVNFVEVAGAAAVRVRTFEKGVEAETLACGTGALASALVARLAGRLSSDDIAVEMPGGTLRVGFRLDGDTAEAVTDLTLEGPAEAVYQGTLTA
ncbi:MAG: diaminopimelate epimerase [Rubricoccaceae bacterium]|nr:diaminopimelate epimerase [Rubricoccaceae bacterium]